MNKILLGIALLASSAAMASALNAPFYTLEDWIGEYPEGYEIIADTEVSAIETPLNPAPLEQACTLKAKSVIHPWAQKTKSEFITLTPVNTYTAIKEFKVELEGGNTLTVPMGAEVLELSYLSEGYCLNEYNGQEYSDECFGPAGEDDRATPKSTSPFQYRAFFKTMCAEGHEAWVDAKDLEDLTEQEEPTVKAAEIEDYGKVKEP